MIFKILSKLYPETCPNCGTSSLKEIRPFQQFKGYIQFWCFDCQRVVKVKEVVSGD